MKTLAIYTLSLLSLLTLVAPVSAQSVEDVVYDAFEAVLDRRPTRDELNYYADRTERERWSYSELKRELEYRHSGERSGQDRRDSRRHSSRDAYESRRWIEASFEEHLGRLPTRMEMDSYCDLCLDHGYNRTQLDRRIADDFRGRQREYYRDDASYDFDRYSGNEEVEWIIADIFRTELDQEVDETSLRKYRRLMLDDGWSERRVRKDILSSPELVRGRYEKYVVRAYEDLLDRTPSPRERDGYVQDMIRHRWDESKLRSMIKKSREYTYDRPRRLIETAYRETLLREPDADAYTLVREIVRRDWSLEDVNAHLRESHEYRTQTVGKMIDLAYAELLNRKPDPYGIQFYSQRVREGWSFEQIKKHIRSSDEYREKHGK
ncbi:MAG: hypothetical protein ABQ298_00780 [Puniceicoccaceae bacterium]